MTKITRWIVLIALFIIPFLPLYVDNSLYFPFITGKAFIFRILVEIAFFGWVVLAFGDKKYRPQFSWTGALFAAFVVWMAIADAFAVNPAKAFWSNFERMDGWITLIHLFLFFVVASSVLAQKDWWRRWWFTFLGVSAVVCGYGLLQLAHVLAIHQGGVRVDATMGNAEYLAAYLLFGMGIALWQAIESRGWLRYTLIVLAILQAVIIFFTATRGAVLALVGAAFVGAILWMIGAGKKSRMFAGGLLVLLVLLAGGFLLVKDSAWVHKDPTLGRISSISIGDLQVRFTLWHMALEGVHTRPITGWGQEGFNYVFNKYYEPSLYAQEPWFDRAHNVFFDWLVSGGVPALALFLALFASTVVALYRGKTSRGERVLLLATLVAYAIQGMVVFDNIFTYIPLIAIFAMAHGVSSRPFRKLEALPELDTNALQTFAGPIAVAAAIATVWFVNVPNMRAGHDLIIALTPTSGGPTENLADFKQALNDGSFGTQEIREQLMNYATGIAADPNIPGDTKQTIATYAISQIDAQVQAAPQDARLHLEYALGYRSFGDFADALKQSAIAHSLSPNKQSILVEEGIEAWQGGQLTLAHDSFAQAYAIDTSFSDLAAYAAIGDIITGDLAGGKALLIEKFGTPIVDNPALLLAYYQARDYNDLIALAQLRVTNQQGAVAPSFQLASAYAAAGRLSEARAVIRATMAAHPEAVSDGTALLQQIGG